MLQSGGGIQCKKRACETCVRYDHVPLSAVKRLHAVFTLYNKLETGRYWKATSEVDSESGTLSELAAGIWPTDIQPQPKFTPWTTSLSSSFHRALPRGEAQHAADAGTSLFTAGLRARQSESSVLVSPALDRWTEKAGRLETYIPMIQALRSGLPTNNVLTNGTPVATSSRVTSYSSLEISSPRRYSTLL